MFDLSFKLEKFIFDRENVELISSNRLVDQLYPMVYILFDDEKMQAYVGESTNAKSRLTNHLSNPKKKKLKNLYLISSDKMNKSAALDIEANLIQYMPSLGFKLFNGNAGLVNHNYFQKNRYNDLFKNIWDDLTFGKAETKSLFEIHNDDIFKYSPYKALTQDQYAAVQYILNALVENQVENFTIDGSAGTGKTILAVYLVKLLASFHLYDVDDLEIEDEFLLRLLMKLKSMHPNGLEIGFVVPMTSLRKTLKEVFGKTYGLKKSMVIGPTDVVKKKYDILLVDESHRLTRRKAITNFGSHDEINRKLGLDKNDPPGTQLDWIQMSAPTKILFYDSEQSIRPADVRKKDFDKIIKTTSHRKVELSSQLRSKGGQDYIKFIDNLLRCKMDSLSGKYNNTEYELVLFDSVKDLVKALDEKEKEHGLSRLMSGYCWEWVSRDGGQPDAIIDGVELTWNRVSSDWINSTTDSTEMGCIHTVQGYDLNYAGVIIGEEIDYDPNEKKITIDKSKYYDKKGKQPVDGEDELKEYIIKIYKTMLFRGISGTYIYVCNKNLKEYLSKYIKKFNS